MSTRLRPTFRRAAASIVGTLALLTAAVYLWEGYRQGHWWPGDYMLTLLIPFTIAPGFVCAMWVPRRFEFSDTHLTVRMPFRAEETIAWDDLEYYGWFEGVYGLQFHSSGTLPFFPWAFPRSDWRALKTFLATTFPDREASGFFAGRLWRRNKT